MHDIGCSMRQAMVWGIPCTCDIPNQNGQNVQSSQEVHDWTIEAMMA